MRKEGNKKFFLGFLFVVGILLAANYYGDTITGQYHRYFRFGDHPILPMLEYDADLKEACLTHGRYEKPLCDGYESFKCAKIKPADTEEFEWVGKGQGDCEPEYSCFCGKEKDEEVRTLRWEKKLLDDGTIAASCVVKIEDLDSDRLPVHIILSGRFDDGLGYDYGIKIYDWENDQYIKPITNINGFYASITNLWCTKQEGVCDFRVDVLFPSEDSYNRPLRLKCISGGSDEKGVIGDVCYTGTPFCEYLDHHLSE